MMARLLLSSLLLLPCLSVSGFQGHGAISRKIPVTFLQQASSVVEESVRISESPSIESLSPLRSNVADLPPVLQQIADERREFQINLGRAMDTLRSDMPEILVKKPDFGIYDEKISVVDPSGVQLTGLDKYKSAFAFFQTFIGFWFSARSSLQFRMVYDFPRSSIRISWNAILIPKVLGKPIFVDGISYYQLDRTSGKIVEHKVEKLMINNTPVAPPYGILSILQQDVLGVGKPASVPVGMGVGF